MVRLGSMVGMIVCFALFRFLALIINSALYPKLFIIKAKNLNRAKQTIIPTIDPNLTITHVNEPVEAIYKNWILQINKITDKCFRKIIIRQIQMYPHTDTTTHTLTMVHTH
jgi:hypothetical protein